MQKKMLIPAAVLISTLLCSCGSIGGLKLDGKEHKLEDGFFLYLDDGSFYYNSSGKGKALKLDVDEEAWETFEYKNEVSYRSIPSEEKVMLQVVDRGSDKGEYYNYEKKALEKHDDTYANQVVAGLRSAETSKSYKTERSDEELQYSFYGKADTDNGIVFDGVNLYPLTNALIIETVVNFDDRGYQCLLEIEEYSYNLQGHTFYTTYSGDSHLGFVYYIDNGGNLAVIFSYYDDILDYAEMGSKRLIAEIETLMPQAMVRNMFPDNPGPLPPPAIRP